MHVNAGTYHIGVNYGLNGDNLPPPKDVIMLYQRCGIEFIRLFEPNSEVLEALQGSNLLVSLGVRNEDLQSLALSQTAANQWVNIYIVPYMNNVSFGWITAGNEVITGPNAQYVYAAMNNIYNALHAVGLVSTRVTTVVSTAILAKSFPPSAGEFSPETFPAINDVVGFLSHTGSPLMINVYPYFAYASEPDHISLEYATFTAKEPIMDGNLMYYNLFDAMVDAILAALEKINGANVSIAIAETGWPSAGRPPYTSVEIAQTYNANLYSHVIKEGTPRRPGNLMDTFVFEMFNENKKPLGEEQNFGLFNPNMQPVYRIFESC